MKHIGITCLNCGTAMFSRAKHDYRSCECGAVEIDGGWDLVRVTATAAAKRAMLFLDVNLPKTVTKKAAWQAWNTRDDSYLFFRATDKWPKWLLKSYRNAVRQTLTSK